MKYNLIICPVDFSECSSLAVELAGRLSKLSAQQAPAAKRKVILLNVVEAGSQRDRPTSLVDSLVNDGMEVLRDKGKFDPEVKVEYLTLKGNPQDAIVHLAKAKKADLIVMGTRGKSAISKILLGSVTQGVMRNAHCPVITVNPPEK